MNRASDLQHALQRYANPNRTEQMERYMKNRFQFLGIGATERRLVFAEFNRANPWKPNQEQLIDFVMACWESPYRELHYCGQEELYRHRKCWNASMLPFLEQLITEQSWWDSVDFLASAALGYYFNQYPEQIRPTINKWLSRSNMWLKRSALLFQLRYKSQTDHGLLTELIEQLADHKDFFIRKAIGWALREYSKTNPGFVNALVSNIEMSGLSKREALRLMNKSS